jgi:UPF0755 protein
MAEKKSSEKTTTSIRNRIVAVAGTIVLLLLIIVATVVYRAFYVTNYPGGENIVVTIPKGASFSTIADLLYEHDVIESRFTFRLAGRLLGWEETMQSGMFEIPPGKTNYELLEDLRYGRLRKVFDITIFEGFTVRQIAGVLQYRMGLDSARVVELAYDSTFAAEFGIDHGSLKGYLLPDRYRFFGDNTEREVLGKLVTEFWNFYDDSLQRRTEELGLTIHQVIIMASIVQGETLLAHEKPIVAGLYYNRIRRRIPLQADATVQYALIDESPRRLLYRDYRIQSPYNTYLFRGLPPGPINNPGRNAILASLFPAEHSYLYMVTDGTGGHTFSETYNQHLRAVRQFRQFRTEQERQRRIEEDQRAAGNNEK